ncbi:MAG: hypothetical protein RIQ79_2016 [Verrucomicrobiota bacterium]|jgi:hypothetical protein
MHIAILTAGRNGTLSIQHLHHHIAGRGAAMPHSRHVNLLIMDARSMNDECLTLATAKVAEFRRQHGLGHGVLLCAKPTLPLLVASIRCGLRDVTTQYIGAAHLLRILRSATPGLTRRDYIEIVCFLRTFNAFSTGEGDATTVARRSKELARLAETLAQQEKDMALEKDRVARMEQDLRERTRRLDRQVARMQASSDVAHPATNPPLGAPDYDAVSRQLDKRAAELDVREKLLNEMEKLLLSTPQAATINKYLNPAAPTPTGVIG